MATPPSYFDAHHLTFEASTAQVLHAEKQTDGDPNTHAYDLHKDAHERKREALLAQALRDLQRPDREAHQQGIKQLRQLTATMQSTVPLRSVASYFLGMCYLEGRGTQKRYGRVIMKGGVAPDHDDRDGHVWAIRHVGWAGYHKAMIISLRTATTTILVTLRSHAY